MKKIISGIVTLIILVFIITSGVFQKLTEFFVWLVTLNMTKSTVSAAGEIFVKIASFVISYSIVGAVFNFFHWYKKEIMKGAYFIVSTIVSFVLCYLVMEFETHLLIFAIVFGCVLAIIIIFGIILAIREIKQKKQQKDTASLADNE